MKKLIMGITISLLLIGISLAAEIEIGWYIPKSHINVGNEITYRPDGHKLIEFVERWGTLLEKLPGEKIIKLAGMKVKHLKGRFTKIPTEIQMKYENWRSEAELEACGIYKEHSRTRFTRKYGNDTYEIYSYWRNDVYYGFMYKNGKLILQDRFERE